MPQMKSWSVQYPITDGKRLPWGTFVGRTPEQVTAFLRDHLDHNVPPEQARVTGPDGKSCNGAEWLERRP